MREKIVRARKSRLFDQLAPTDPPYAIVIDPCIARDDRGTEQPDDDRWVMVVKNELGADKGGKNLRLTFSDKMQGPYQTKLGPPIVGAGTSIVDQMAEGPSLFKRQGQWFLYWDAPESPFSYCLSTSPDLKTWTNRSRRPRSASADQPIARATCKIQRTQTSCSL